MGMNVIPLKELTPDESKVVTIDLLKNMDPNDAQNEKSRGQLVVELVYKPFKDNEIPNDIEDSNAVEKVPEGTPAGGGLLVVIVHEAQDVEGKHHTNPYVKLLFRGEERRTKVHHSPCNNGAYPSIVAIKCNFPPSNGEDSINFFVSSSIFSSKSLHPPVTILI